MHKNTRSLFKKSLVLVCTLLISQNLWSQTTGPSQTEYQSFGSAEVSEMVDLFTGDFSYKIKLFDLPGPHGSYPFVLNYNSGVRMTDEASWVGFGWNLNGGGVITRNMRGIPDDFNGENLKHISRKVPSLNYGIGGKVNLEILGADLSTAGLDISGGVTVYYNNYKGIGISRDIGVGFRSNKSFADELNGNAGINVGLSIDNLEGSSLSLSAGMKLGQNDFNASTTINSREGMNGLNLNYDGIVGPVNRTFFAKRTYVPFPSPEMSGWNVSLDIKFGSQAFPVNIYGGVKGFYTENSLRNTGEVSTPSYGYLYLQNETDASIMDFNREKDGILREKTPNLAIPSLTYDLFSVSGDGIGGTFRAFRNDMPLVHDKRSSSDIEGFGLGVEIGGGQLVKVGANENGNGTFNNSGSWDDSNFNSGKINPQAGSVQEYYQFRFIDEPTIGARFLVGDNDGDADVERTDGEAFFGTQARRIKLDGTDRTFPKFESDRSSERDIPTMDMPEARVPRGNLIQSFTNKELSRLSGILPETVVKYYDEAGNLQTMGRGNDDKIGAFIITTTNGMRYVYALPVYNLEQYEKRQSSAKADGCIFLINDSDDYSPNSEDYETDESQTRSYVPSYAYGYLLTSVLGDNYVDLDSVPGPSDGDLGEFYIFKYTKQTNPYLWRSPFSRATYEKGFLNNGYLADDRLSVTWGKKELYYLKEAESKTHISEFETSVREDGYGANTPGQNNPDLGEPMRRLDRILLFSKIDRSVPVKAIHFTYSYDLIKKTPNNKNTTAGSSNSGKLTLTKLHINHEGSTRGQLSPYEFDYKQTDPKQNPDFTQHALDRWGMYRAISACEALAFPYTKQGNPGELNANSSNWHLKELTTPSGGTIKVDYEADNYSHVQDRKAVQMVKIEGIDNTSASSNLIDNDNANKIFFKLNRSVPTVEADREVSRYFEGISELLFKVKINLKNDDDPMDEFVSGYGTIDSWGRGPADGRGMVSTGWVTLKKKEENKYHPFCVAAWQHLRLTQPELLSGSPFDSDPGASAAEEALKAIMLIDFVGAALDIAKGFNRTADNDDWGKELDLAYSYIRTNVPNGKKFGGGTRVKQITLSDEWNSSSIEPTQTTGQVYLYDMDDGSSSGVASYEPSLGGEENPFRTAKKFRQDLNFSSPYFLYFEEPSNEAYFPSPVVGYRRVKVRSIIADRVIRKDSSSTIPTTGEVVHEFYTAKEYPTKTDETLMKRKPYKTFHLVPLIGFWTYDNMTASMGYSLVSNNMHGKKKAVSYHGLDEAGNVLEMPVKSLRYYYSDTTDLILGGERSCIAKELIDGEPKLISKYPLQNFEAFVDSRKTSSITETIGANINTDGFMAGPIPLMIPTVWPNYSYNESITRTMVANRIIHRNFVMTKSILSEAGAEIVTENLAYDAVSGQLVLTSVNNRFGNKEYDYKIPAYWYYSGMGPGYKNIGVELTGSLSQLSGTAENQYFLAADPDQEVITCSLLMAGDEYEVVYSSSETAPVRAYCITVIGSGVIIQTNSPLSLGASGTRHVTLRVLRSGRRNNLTAIGSVIRSLSHPIEARVQGECEAQEICEVTTATAATVAAAQPVQNAFRSFGLATRHFASSRKTLKDADPKYGKTLRKHRISRVKLKGKNKAVFNYSEKSGPSKFCLALTDTSFNLVPLNKPIQILSITPANDPQLAGKKVKGLSFAKTKVQALTQGGKRSHFFLFTDHPEMVSVLEEYTVPQAIVCHTDPAGDIPVYSLPNVLQASATTYSGTWNYTLSDLRFGVGPEAGSGNYSTLVCPYATGELGTWRPERTFWYNGNRVQSTPMKLATDGVFEKFEFFDWKHPMYSCAGWKVDQRMVRYNPFDFETQREDIYGVHSSSLFAYNNSLNVAYANQAAYHEIGFESWEEYPEGAGVNHVTASTGNIDFIADATTVEKRRIEIDFDLTWILGDYYRLDEIDFGDGHTDPVPDYLRSRFIIKSINMFGIDGSFVDLDPSATSFYPSEDYFILDAGMPDSASQKIGLNVGSYNSRPVSGKLRVIGDTYFDPLIVTVTKEGDISVSNEKAHAGKKSLKVKKAVDFQQYRLSLEPGKKYVLSSWVSRNLPNPATYDMGTADAQNIGIRIDFVDAANQVLPGTVFAKPAGPIIEEWQKIEAEFIPPAGTARIIFGMQNGSDGVIVFFDDMRVSPAESKMETYVYDSRSYKLVALLDENNYSQFFSYDEEGALYLIRKETERGIYSTKEIHSHVKEH